MRKSTDFKSWLEKEETKEKLKDKTVLMFCTGGIRCERASAYLKNKLGNEVEEVYQVRCCICVD
jgi:predicted sulfurtransferase